MNTTIICFEQLRYFLVLILSLMLLELHPKQLYINNRQTIEPPHIGKCMYKIKDYSYFLPKKLISQNPTIERGDSRLLRMNRKTGYVSHHLFKDVDQFFKSSDVLVINDTKVIPGKLIGRKKSGGKVEVLVINFAENLAQLSSNPGVFECLIQSSNPTLPGTILLFEGSLEAVILNFSNGVYCVEFSNAKLFEKIMYEFGKLPLPPYIKRKNLINTSTDLLRYQTIYATENGSIAAPTAGLHFTEEIMNRIRSIGVTIARITLHVGYGTFLPVRVNDIRQHKMHPEYFSVSQNSANTINKAKTNGSRIIAVGTTSVRTLEFLAQKSGMIHEENGKCNLFIYPGYAFKIVDVIITNFHLPQSTLLMLIAAFSSKNSVLDSYQIAIQHKYRFFSYGDAMIID